MSAIRPNKNFYNEGPDYIFDYQAHISSSALTKTTTNINIPNKKVNAVYERFFKDLNS
jgi:hypothetical protein